MVKTRSHQFDHYSVCIVPVVGSDIDQTAPLTYENLETLRKAWLKCIKPLFRHMENPEDVGVLLSAFDGNPKPLPVRPGLSASDHLWQLIDQIAHLFPTLIFTQVEKTIAMTQGRDPRMYSRSKWINKRLEKDLEKCRERLRKMRDEVRMWIGDCEENGRDEKFLVLEHILDCVLQEVHGKAVMTLIRMLVTGRMSEWYDHR